MKLIIRRNSVAATVKSNPTGINQYSGGAGGAKPKEGEPAGGNSTTSEQGQMVSEAHQSNGMSKEEADQMGVASDTINQMSSPAEGFPDSDSAAKANEALGESGSLGAEQAAAAAQEAVEYKQTLDTAINDPANENVDYSRSDVESAAQNMHGALLSSGQNWQNVADDLKDNSPDTPDVRDAIAAAERASGALLSEAALAKVLLENLGLEPEFSEGSDIFGRTGESAASVNNRKSRPTSSTKFKGKTVRCVIDGKPFVGIVHKQVGGDCVVIPAIPNDEGILLFDRSSEPLIVDSRKFTSFDGVSREAKIREFDTFADLPKSELKFTSLYEKSGDTEGKYPVDYRDIGFVGYASTFLSVTKADRDGDHVVDGAFTKTIRRFLKNPVLLIDHKNCVGNIAGQFKNLVQNHNGLQVEAAISNSPSLAHVRHLVAEGVLKTLSIGGLFLYGNDGKAIEEVDLYEISLVAVPANPDALIEVRSISLDRCSKAFKNFKASRSLRTR